MTLASGAKTAIADTRFPKKIALSADGSRLYAAVGDTNILQVQEGGRCRRGSWVWRLGVAVVLSGHCRVMCTEPPRVQVMLSTGATTTVATGLSYAYGVVLSADGTLPLHLRGRVLVEVCGLDHAGVAAGSCVSTQASIPTDML